MLPRVFPEGTSGEGGTRLCREGPGLDAALHRARHMAPQASRTRDSTQRDVWWGGATIFRQGVVSAGRRMDWWNLEAVYGSAGLTAYRMPSIANLFDQLIPVRNVEC
jgi:hypothetical protein